jgi:autotransporter family porin
MPVPPARTSLALAAAATLPLVVALSLIAAACGGDGDSHFATLGPGAQLPDGEICRELVASAPTVETHPGNREANATVEAPPVAIDGADDDPLAAGFAARIDGDFTGTTEQILRWGACKWGFDEDITRARAVTESSWSMATAGDVTEDEDDCASLGLQPPCSLSYGLLQVKGTVHTGTHPATSRATAFGVDYAMAWLRACYEGAFHWLDDQGYEAGDEWGCVGAWFTGEWWDRGAYDYVEEVRGHLEARTWEEYGATTALVPAQAK